MSTRRDLEVQITEHRVIALPAFAVAMVGCGVFFPGNKDSAAAVALIVVGAGMFFIAMILPTLTEFKIGPSGFSGKLRERDREVKATLEPESESLMRTATALTGSPQAGKELLERALLEAYMRWQQAQREGPADTVRKILGDLAPAVGKATTIEPSETS